MDNVLFLKKEQIFWIPGRLKLVSKSMTVNNKLCALPLEQFNNSFDIHVIIVYNYINSYMQIIVENSSFGFGDEKTSLIKNSCH